MAVLGLSALPNELLSLVATYLDRPRDLSNLALCSRRLSTFVKLDGWKAFLRGRFDLAGLDADARSAVHGLTTLCRNWDRKAFVARYLEPPLQTSLNTWDECEWTGPQGQTMGYQPCIDSYECVHASWSDRREVLAWSAGTHVVLRVKQTAPNALPPGPATPVVDHFKHAGAWYTYKIPDSSEGYDDITTMKLIRPYEGRDPVQRIAFGTASGRLSVLSADLTLKETREQLYDTNSRPVGSLSLSHHTNPLMAATLENSTLALYSPGCTGDTEDLIQPQSQTTPILPGTAGRLWSCNFLSKDKVAVGLGPSQEPIQVYEVTPTGFLSQPLRKFSLESSLLEGTRSRNTSVYPILPVSPGSRSASEAGHVFLSGGYDGLIRLHDMRSQRNFETIFWDVTNDSAVYSLAMQGLERVVAGTSMHSMLKVFDLRFAGSHAYHTISLPPNPQPKPRSRDSTYNAIINEQPEHESSVTTGGWNLYLNPRNSSRNVARRGPQRRQARSEDSPVYSISVPSHTSPNLYTGLEGTIQSLTFLSTTDPHPDPLLSQPLTYLPESNIIDVKSSYDPLSDVLNLGMYEQGSEEGLGMRLMIQGEVGGTMRKDLGKHTSARFATLDERWKDPSEEGDKWNRGQELPEPVSRGGRRGRGRRRGRGV